MKARLPTLRYAPSKTHSRNGRSPRLWTSAFILFVCFVVPSSLRALTPTQAPTPTATPSGLTLEDLIGSYDVALEVEGEEPMTGEGRVSERDGGSVSIVANVIDPSGLPAPSLRLRGRLSPSGSIDVSGVYNTDGDILNQATGTVIARRVREAVQISGPIEYSGVRSGTVALTMTQGSSSTSGGGGGGCKITTAAGRQRPDAPSAILLGTLLLAVAARRARRSSRR